MVTGLDNTYIPVEWVAEYKNAVWKLLVKKFEYEIACELYDSLESDFENLNFDNPDYNKFYGISLISDNNAV